MMAECSRQTVLENISSSLYALTKEAQELYLPKEITRLSSPPKPIDFLRQFVMANLPVVIEGGCKHWPAIKRWTNKYLLNKLGDQKITVAVTPNGYADAPLGEHFVLPDEQQMTFKEFLDLSDDSNDGDVAYIQKQNSSFTDEFSNLLGDAESDISWASEAFNKEPDAINFWMGDDQSITSMHKDHYENIYAVVRGQKTFILQPPTDLPCIPYNLYDLARYKKNSVTGVYEIIKELDSIRCENCTNQMQSTPPGTCHRHTLTKVPWISIDPLAPDLHTYPAYANTNRLVAVLNPGDLLYLPSLWFHHVRQSKDTIAVNFWYDMEYDIKYNYFKCIESIKEQVKELKS